MAIRECTQEEWDAMIADIEASKATRAAKMPDEAAALAQMHEAWTRLKELGFREAQYAPKGETLQFIEIGSTAIHIGHRDDKSDSVLCWLEEAGDLWPSRPVLWRKRPPTTNGDSHSEGEGP